MNFSILSWNVRGQGSAEKVRAVTRVVAESKAMVVFIQESKLAEVKSWVAKRLKGKNWVASGSLLLRVHQGYHIFVGHKIFQSGRQC
ncbi:hypothetical protein HRI_002071300 [Hibiscus trionum]|uniref:Endonuclease/exonuclease/phosphatase domain-containing protein n=1 Tax=Hibiscus trionum TaxID=183268 RepID=A0A9W7M2Z1_HIBTR|nr:hypothetical protein HRI_002071300 [Hibiscus trionum]